MKPQTVASNKAFLYARVSSKKQDREGYSIPAQCKLLRSYAQRNRFEIVHEFIDVETAKQSGHTHVSEMIRFLEGHPRVRTLLCEKTDRLCRNFKDYVTIDELDLTLIFVKEGSILSKSSRSHEKFIHGIKVLMAKNYIDQGIRLLELARNAAEFFRTHSQEERAILLRFILRARRFRPERSFRLSKRRLTSFTGSQRTYGSPTVRAQKNR